MHFRKGMSPEHLAADDFVDREFNTTDVCLLMDTAAMSARHKGFYIRKHEARA